MTMADISHYQLILLGAEAWNRWRKEHSTIQPDLSGTSLVNLTLPGIDLSGTNLQNTHFHKVDLSTANLCYTNISHARLSLTSLNMVNAQQAICRGTQFLKSDLIRANLSEADLSGA